MNDVETAVAKYAADGFSLTVLLGTFVNILPSISSLLTFIWALIRIWETDTVQRWIGRKD